MTWNKIVKEKSDKYPPPPNYLYTYGTAGFRTESSLLPCAMFRMGCLALLRSRYLNGKVVGVMITASHNPVQDNGVKIVDPMGEMLESEWEEIATKLANAKDFVDELQSIMKRFQLNIDQPGKVIVARDTRPSGEKLSEAVIEGILSLEGQAADFGLLTTPQCHYIVRASNSNYGEPNENGYYEKFSRAYMALLQDHRPRSKLILDAANGIGGPKMKALAKFIDSEYLNIEIINNGTGELNHLCGSDHVKVSQSAPSNITPAPGQRCATIDGDADRLMYFYFDQNAKFHMLDGDRLASLCALYFAKLVKELSLSLSIGVVQTAYANGSSTSYLKGLGLPVVCVETGVKHLHHRASDFDIGIYFEANGHGTVLFGPKTIESTKDSRNMKLKMACDLINQAVGDALSVMLFVEASLINLELTMEQWDNLYVDLPNRLSKQKVIDRSIFKTTNADTELVEPIGFQEIINNHVKSIPKGRAFVRPSGTEDVVRIYSEAETQENADVLNKLIANDIKKRFE